MSWMQKLCEAYDAGIVCDQSKETEALAPLGFVRKAVKYHMVLTFDGKFVSADELPKDSQMQMIPSTPQAESRTSTNGTPFPLTEQLKYLAYEESNLKLFTQYREQLKAWCEQPDAPVCLQAVYTYLDGHTLLTDLESQPGLKLKYYKKAGARGEFGEDAKAFLCFSVQMPDGSCDDLWRREDVKLSWTRYLEKMFPGEREFCYVEGRMLPVLKSHPKLQGNAKLISAKDTEFPFQYKGRFMDDRSAAHISFDASVRAHNALAWLINRQGTQKYGMTWVVWNTNGAPVKVPIDEQNGFMEEEEETASKPVIDTFAGYAEAVGSAARGYGGRLHDYNKERTDFAVILGLEAATDGRMSVTYYQECPGNEYVKRLENWYKDCCWWQYSRNKKGKQIAAPNLDQIAAAVMGADAVNLAKKDLKCEKSYTKLMRKLQSRLLICIVDQQPLPLDVVRGAFHRACAPLAFVSGKNRQWSRSAWERCVDTACALILCFQRRSSGENNIQRAAVYPELQENFQNRDYLYGRLLAVADRIEEKAMTEGRDYPTNAIRFMQKFSRRPFETWPEIYEKLMPNFEKLGWEGIFYQKKLEEIEVLFSGEDRYERRELSFEFLQGYSSQRQASFQMKQADKVIPDVEEAVAKDVAKVTVEDAEKVVTEEVEKAEEAVAEKSEIKEADAERILYKLPRRRSEVYGCLLAIADVVEQEVSEGRRVGKTNASHMVQVFAARPYESWGKLHDRLIPYLEKLGVKAEYYQRLIGMVEMQFLQSDREAKAPLDGSYPHGYYCMRRALHQKTEFSGEPQTWELAEDMRSAVYGLMLGTADWIERSCLVRLEEKRRMTNEVRLMTAFAQMPVTIWENLKVKLKPYQKMMGYKTAGKYAALEQLEIQLHRQGWDVNTPLGSIYLHNYYKERNKYNL